MPSHHHTIAPSRRPALSSLVLACTALAACSSPGTAQRGPVFMQDRLPVAVQVPAGHKVAMITTTDAGQITYECREKKDMAGSHEWVFVGPIAMLHDPSGKAVGRYFGPPATWASNDGSAITGVQVAVAPAGAGAIPLQLVKANPAVGQGSMAGVTYVQRVATQGGVAPSHACAAVNRGSQQTVTYKADYIFWKAV